MIRKENIRAWTIDSFYRRGRELFREKKVLNPKIEKKAENTVHMEAEVKGSGKNFYYCEAEVNVQNGELLDYFCECPVNDSYAWPCKHVVALLLEYEEQEKKKNKKPPGNVNLFKKESARRPTIPVRTTPAMAELLSKRAEKRALPVIQSQYYGRVRLEPKLYGTAYKLELEFKIGVERMYVLKNLFEFADAVSAGRQHDYGKQLGFVHTMEMFDEESRPLVDFITAYIKAYRRGHRKSYYNSFYYDGPSQMRRMELVPSDLEQFLLAVGRREFSAEIDGEDERHWRVTEEKIKREMRIRGEEDGIEVSINYLSGYRGDNYLIYFSAGRVYMDPVERMERVMDFNACMAQIPERTVYIDAVDVPTFCRELLPALEEIYVCQRENFNPEKYGMVPAEFEFYMDAESEDFITCRPEVVYGERRYSLYEEEMASGRDVLREAVVRELVSRYGNAFDKANGTMAAAGDDDLIFELLTRGIPALQGMGTVYISDRLKKIEVRESPGVTVGVSLSEESLTLSLQADNMTREELIEILSKYKRKKKYYRLKNGEFIRMEETGLAALKDMQEDLAVSVEALDSEKITLPRFRALYLDAKGKETDSLHIEKDRGFRALVRNMKTAVENDFEVPVSLQPMLREYQREGFIWLKTLCQNGFGGILADDMGLGKTLQVICFLLSEYEEAEKGSDKRTLIISPASLVYNWKREIERFAPKLSPRLVVGTAAEREKLIRGAGEREILLTSYDLLRRDIEEYEKLNFFCEVIDEAQFIKNHNTKAARAVKRIAAGFRIALTGTPVENRLSELWSIFDYLMPGFLYSYRHFRESLELPIVQDQDGDKLERLQKMIGPFVLRRLKADVLRDLPDKLEENVAAPLQGEQRELYQAHVQRMKLMLEAKSDEEFRTSKIQVLAELTRLRQLCCDPSLLYEDYRGNSEKTELCMDLLERAIEGGHKILLFSQFTTMLEELQKQMSVRGISYYTLTGSTAKEERARLVEQFNGDDTPVFCISLKAGGTGLNLTAADVVIHYDPWWNVAVQNQATDRAHRIGQKRVVNVYRLVMQDSIEENIIALQEKKRELAEQVLSGEQVGSAGFTREDIMEILGETDRN